MFVVEKPDFYFLSSFFFILAFWSLLLVISISLEILIIRNLEVIWFCLFLLNRILLGFIPYVVYSYSITMPVYSLGETSKGKIFITSDFILFLVLFFFFASAWFARAFLKKLNKKESENEGLEVEVTNLWAAIGWFFFFLSAWVVAFALFLFILDAFGFGSFIFHLDI